MIQVRVFRTAKEFVEWIGRTFPSTDGAQPDLDRALWVICLCEARIVSEGMSLQNIANMFLYGITAYHHDPMGRIQTFLSTILERVEDAIIDGGLHITEDGFLNADDAKAHGIFDIEAEVSRLYAG